MQKSFLMRRFLKDPRLLNSSLKQMSGTLRGKKDKTRLVLLFHLGKIKKCIEINKFKQLKNWNLPIVRLASLFSVQTVPTYCCSHKNARIYRWTQAVRPFCWKCYCQECAWQFNTTEVTFSFVCSPQGFFHSSLVSCRQNTPLSRWRLLLLRPEFISFFLWYLNLLIPLRFK